LGFRHRSSVASRVPVPKASMYEERDSQLGKTQIRRPRQIFSMKTEAQPESVRHLPHENFGPGVVRSDARHSPRSLLRRNPVHGELPKRARRARRV
jgi:hypothetical protein